jgi:adenine-specific DNA-methyltransferase
MLMKIIKVGNIYKNPKVAEPRVLKFVKNYGDVGYDNMLIKGDNLLVLRSLVEMFKGKAEKDRVKCIYIDPPFNTGNAFQLYDDNLQHSEWLTMMRDRLKLLKNLLRHDGVIFIHINDEELAYLKILCDEIFGRKNYLNTISIRTKESSGASGGGEDKRLKKNIEFILCYGGAEFKKFYPLYEDQELMSYIKEMKEAGKSFKYINVLYKTGNKEYSKTIKDGLGKEIKIYEVKDYEIKTVKQIAKEENISNEEVYKKYYERIITTTNAQTSIRGRVWEATDNKNNMYAATYVPATGKNKGKETELLFIGKQKVLIIWLKNSSIKKGKSIYKRIKVGTYWSGDSWINVTKEGKVRFPNGKKPESLIKKCIDISTNEGDVVLDSFAGSGTTGSVAHKMNRRWIMVEIGSHSDKIIIPRLQRIINGNDESGVSKAVNWEGGGGFKYYLLGNSLIHEKDMNWVLRAEEMAEAIFLHFQYKQVKAEWLEKENMYLGRHHFALYHFALSFASRETKFLTEDLYEKIIAGLDKEKFKHLTIFTNVAVTVPPKSLDDRVFIKKIPAAILREYSLL